LRDMLGPTMRTALAVLTLCVLAAPAQAGFKVCNRTPHEAKVALGRFDGTGWLSEGWWKVSAKGCAVLLTSPLNSRYYYLYATDDASGGWDGKNGFCVGESDTFQIRGRADCAGHGYDRKGFFEIDTGQARDYTQTLSD
jgi:uncharacterized membrane protein